VTEVVFPWNIPNINSTTRKMLISIFGGATYEVVIPTSFYKPSQLATALQTSIRALDPAFAAMTVEYGRFDEPVFAFDFGVASVKFLPMQYQPNPALPFVYPYQNSKQLFDLLGFNNTNQSDFQSTFSGDSTLCQSTRYIDIVCSVLTYNQSLKDTTSQPVSRDALVRVYLGSLNSVMTVPASDPDFAPPGTTPGVVYAQYSAPKQIQWIPNQPVPSGLRFQIFDDEGTPVDELFAASFGTNQWIGDINWSMSILVSEN
jgi:hypothetical protein